MTEEQKKQQSSESDDTLEKLLGPEDYNNSLKEAILELCDRLYEYKKSSEADKLIDMIENAKKTKAIEFVNYLFQISVLTEIDKIQVYCTDSDALEEAINEYLNSLEKDINEMEID